MVLLKNARTIKMYQRICKACGKMFVTSFMRQKTHSIECRIVYNRKKAKEQNRKRYALRCRQLNYTDKVSKVNSLVSNDYVIS
jgi:hypothetical protein